MSIESPLTREEIKKALRFWTTTEARMDSLAEAIERLIFASAADGDAERKSSLAAERPKLIANYISTGRQLKP